MKMKTKTVVKQKIIGAYEKLAPLPVLGTASVLAGSVVQSALHKQYIRWGLGEDGYWYNRQWEARFTSPSIHIKPLGEVMRVAEDLWCHTFTPSAGDVVIDCGAGIGEETLLFSRLVGSRGRVVSIEPDRVVFECLCRNMEQNSLRNVLPLQVALGEEEGTAAWQHEASHIASHLIEGEGVEGEETVRVVRLERLLREHKIDRIALLKMNIEGAELKVLRSIEEHLDRIDHLVISCHDFLPARETHAPVRTFDEVLALLEQRGYQITTRQDDPRPWARFYVYADRG